MQEIKAFLRYFLGSNVIVLMNVVLKHFDPSVGSFWFWETLVLWSMWVGLKYLEERNEDKDDNKGSGSGDSLLHS